MSQRRLAWLLNVDERTVRRWASPTSPAIEDGATVHLLRLWDYYPELLKLCLTLHDPSAPPFAHPRPVSEHEARPCTTTP